MTSELLHLCAVRARSATHSANATLTNTSESLGTRLCGKQCNNKRVVTSTMEDHTC